CFFNSKFLSDNPIISDFNMSIFSGDSHEVDPIWRFDLESGRLCDADESREKNPWGKKKAQMQPKITPIAIAMAIRDPSTDD
ncbi:hypothetical protein ACO1MO_13720, partial [Staphylococcus aureus]